MNSNKKVSRWKKGTTQIPYSFFSFELSHFVTMNRDAIERISLESI